jgi:hypothetical protein
MHFGNDTSLQKNGSLAHFPLSGRVQIPIGKHPLVKDANIWLFQVRFHHEQKRCGRKASAGTCLLGIAGVVVGPNSRG